MGGDHAIHRTEHHRQRIQIGSEQKAQRIGKREHPLAQRALWQHFLSAQRSGVGHAPRTTRGTESALLAAERNQLLGVAVPAAHTQEAFLQPTARQLGVELILDVVRQRTACRSAHLAE
jgi:hypothetical protein